jgi:hypothetical protein
MNTIQLLREAGPEGPDLTFDARNAARAALLAEVDGERPRSRRMPSRKVRWRVGGGVVAVAASWAAAVVIAAPDGPGTPADSVRLVEFHVPTFPLSLDPEPAGLRPAFDGDGEGASIVSYHDEEYREGFAIYISEDEPEQPDDVVGGPSRGDIHDVEVNGSEAEVVHGSENWCWGPDGSEICAPRGFTELVWERGDDQWVRIEGHGSYDDTSAVIAVAESLVDRPQPATLDMGVAPDGWEVQFYKMGRVLTLVNSQYEQQSLTVHIPLPDEVVPAGQVRESIMGPIGPQLDVTVNGRPAQLVRVDIGYVVDGHRYEGWYLQAQFEDGTTFVVQAPEAFTQEQVLELAESVTHNT